MALPIEETPIGGGGSTGGDGGAGGSGGTNVGTAIFTETFNKDQADSDVRVLAYASVYSGDDLQFAAFLTVDGTVQQVGQVNAIFDQQNSQAAMPITLPAYISGLGAGSHTIVFSIRNREPDSALTVMAGSYLEITELKNAAI